MRRSKPKGEAKASGRTKKRIPPDPDVTLFQQIQPCAKAETAITGAVIGRILRSSRCLLIARLAAPVAHEIINPVSAVVNLTTLMRSMLKDDSLAAQRGEEYHGYLSQAISEAARAGRIASEMLAFARATSREPSRVDLNEIVRRTYSLAAHLLKTEDVESRLALTDGLPWIRCDSTEVQHALLHLVVNAAEAVEGREHRQVTISTCFRADGLALLTKVLDTGEGMSPERQLTIFDPFFTTKKRPENLGLGLTVARAIMEAHRGSITVESQPGKATSVTLALPVDDERERG